MGVPVGIGHSEQRTVAADECEIDTPRIDTDRGDLDSLARRGPQPFAHFDMYRISTMEDLQATGFFDYLDDGAVVAAEWSENVAPLVAGEPAVHVDIAVLDEHRRRITIEGAQL